MRAGNFDRTFYEMFRRNSHERLQQLVSVAENYRSGASSYRDLADAVRIPLHNMVGEARLLDMPDIARLIARLSHRVARADKTDQTALDPNSVDRLMTCARTLEALTEAISKNASADVSAEKNAYEEALVELERAYE